MFRSPNPDKYISFATWNIDTNLIRLEGSNSIANATHDDWKIKKRIEKLQEVINRELPDILHLQEARKLVNYKNEEVDSLTPLKEFLKSRKYKISTQDYLQEDSNDPFYYITAYQSQKFKRLSAEPYSLLQGNKKQVALVTELLHKKTNMIIHTFNLHISAGIEEGKKENISKAILEWIKGKVESLPSVKLIVAGDFNSFYDKEGEKQIKILTDYCQTENLMSNCLENYVLPNGIVCEENLSTFFAYPYDFIYKDKISKDRGEAYLEQLVSPEKRAERLGGSKRLD